MRFFIVFIFLLVGCSKGEFENNQGVSKLKSEDFIGAHDDFLQALVFKPESMDLRYNLAFSLIPAERLKDSLHELEQIQVGMSENDTEFYFKTNFAQAFIYSLLGDIDVALEHYQNCLKIMPDSKQVKTNIELLFAGSGKGKGKGGKKGKDKGDPEKSEKDNSSGDDDDEQSGDKEDQDPQGRDDSSLEKKNLSKEELERIMDELKRQEKKIRLKGAESKEKTSNGGKPW